MFDRIKNLFKKIFDKKTWWVFFFIINLIFINNFMNLSVKSDYYGSPNSPWEYMITITINHSYIPQTLYNFPFLFNYTSENFTNYALINGNDFVFTLNETGEQLNHEIENYDYINGNLLAWVNITCLSSVNDTLIDLYFGNSDSENMENVANTWDDYFLGVYHFNEIIGKTFDSSYHSNTLIYSATEPTAITGLFDGGMQFGNNKEYHNSIDIGNSDENITVEVWHKWEETSFSDNYPLITNYAQSSQNGFYMIGTDDGKTMFWWLRNNLKSGVKSGEYEPAYDNLYHYYVGVKDDVNMRTKFYIDGNLKFNASYNSDCRSSGAYFSINKHSTSQYNYGNYDEIRISSITRNDSWVNASFYNYYYPEIFYSISNVKYSPYFPPISISNIYPISGSNDIDLNPTISFMINHSLGKKMNVDLLQYNEEGMEIIYISSYDGVTPISSVYKYSGNGTYYFKLLSSSVLEQSYALPSVWSFNQTFYWRILVTDEDGKIAFYPNSSFLYNCYNFTTKLMNDSGNDTYIISLINNDMNFLYWYYPLYQENSYDTNMIEGQDDNWETFESLNYPVYYEYDYWIYHVPFNAINFTWKVKDGYGITYFDLSEYNFYGINLKDRVLSQENVEFLACYVPDMEPYIQYYLLWGAGDYAEIGEPRYTYDNEFYEDAIIWYIQNETQNISLSVDSSINIIEYSGISISEDDFFTSMFFSISICSICFLIIKKRRKNES